MNPVSFKQAKWTIKNSVMPPDPDMNVIFKQSFKIMQCPYMVGLILLWRTTPGLRSGEYFTDLNVRNSIVAL